MLFKRKMYTHASVWVCVCVYHYLITLIQTCACMFSEASNWKQNPRMPERQTYRHQRKICSHSCCGHWKNPLFLSAANKVAYLFPKPWGFAYGLCADSKPPLPKISHWKTITGHNHWPKTYHSPKMTVIYFNTLSEKRDNFYRFRKIFPLTE